MAAATGYSGGIPKIRERMTGRTAPTARPYCQPQISPQKNTGMCMGSSILPICGMLPVIMGSTIPSAANIAERVRFFICFFISHPVFLFGLRRVCRFTTVEGVYPVGFEIIDKEHHATGAPRERVRAEDRFNDRERPYSKGDVCHAQDAPARKHGEHRHARPSRAAHNCRNAVGKCQCKKEKALGAHLRHADGDDRRVVIEYSYDIWAYEIKYHAEKLCY